jgi:cysteine desulfurase
MNDTTQQPIYLDYNAATPLFPEVLDAMLPYLRDDYGNPSSDHALGRRARAAVERAREQVAAFLGCHFDEVIFTSGGTEASNLAIRGAAAAAGDRRHVVTTTIEHPATAESCKWLERQGWSVTYVPVDAQGLVRIDEMRAAISSRTALVTLMHANNETGVLQPIADVAHRARDAGAVIHVDAAQTAGKVRLDVRELGVDLLSLAGQKVYAPKGVGALFTRRGTTLFPQTLGAGHEQGLRPGTENVPAIVGFGTALEIAGADLDAAATRMRTLRDSLWHRLRAGVPGIALNGHPELRLPNTLNVRFPEVAARALLRAVPQIAASAGSACHAGTDIPSPVLLAMGLTSDVVMASLRLSIGRQTTEDDIAYASGALVEAWRSLRPTKSRYASRA